MGDSKTASKKGAKKGGASKAAFVRAQPRTMAAKDVVAKAKTEGMALTDSYVYKLRSDAAPPKRGPGRPPKAGGARRGRRPDAGSKTAFVLSLPFELPAADVVKQGAERGMKISDKYVYSIRSSKRAKVKKSGGPAPGAAPRGRVPRAVVSTPRVASTGGGDIEQQFVRLAVALGTSRAGELLKRLDAKLASITL
jgi:hypothetical protein